MPWFFTSLFTQVIIVPLSFGMLGAYFATKKGEARITVGIENSFLNSYTRGYAGGLLWCFWSSVVLALIGVFVGLFFNELAVAELLGLMLGFVFFINVISILAGLILCLPGCLMGYNLLARRLAEEKIAQDHGT